MTSARSVVSVWKRRDNSSHYLEFFRGSPTSNHDNKRQQGKSFIALFRRRKRAMNLFKVFNVRVDRHTQILTHKYHIGETIRVHIIIQMSDCCHQVDILANNWWNKEQGFYQIRSYIYLVLNGKNDGFCRSKQERSGSRPKYIPPTKGIFVHDVAHT